MFGYSWLGLNFHFVRTWQPASVSSTACMGLWNTAAPCEWGTTLHTSKSALLRGKRNSTTRTCQVRVPLSSALDSLFCPFMKAECFAAEASFHLRFSVSGDV